MRKRMIWTRGLPVALVASAVACIVPPRSSDSLKPSSPEVYRLAAPDEIQVSVRGMDTPMERRVFVRPDGLITFDLIGEVRASARTLSEVGTEIEERLHDFIVAPDVTVTLIASNSRHYYVFGEVNRVGTYPLVGDVTAIEALASAGGPTLLANPNGSWLARANGESPSTFRVRFDDITLRGDGTTNYVLQPGDVIYVPPGASAQIGNALRTLFYPLQQILGLGGRFVRPASL